MAPISCKLIILCIVLLSGSSLYRGRSVAIETPGSLDPSIVFHSDREGDFEIYSTNADGTDQTRLTNNNANDLVPDWSRSIQNGGAARI